MLWRSLLAEIGAEQGVKGWPSFTYLTLGAVIALATCSGAAQAGSRFETTPSASPEAVTQLDFTIVVPEIVYLGPGRSRARQDLERPKASGKPDGVTLRGPYLVITNAGTLATGTDKLQMQTFSSQSQLPERPSFRVYVVATP